MRKTGMDRIFLGDLVAGGSEVLKLKNKVMRIEFVNNARCITNAKESQDIFIRLTWLSK